MNKGKVFIIMPFAEDFFESYEMLKTHFSEDFEFSHAGDEDNQQNILGLIENKYTATDENKESLVGYLKALWVMKNTASESNESMNGLKQSMLDNIGLERSMNQAIRFAEEDLTTYVNTIIQMIASIDRIIAKSRFIVGNIEFESEVTTND